ncbi:unnamed protein product [Periconia digitata]|uniref:N-acetylgalactosaminide beta-1,3-galactosyltransferase n=1 Tax=Periconia digitata TaxID=1303443 RepID=A0A9W4UGJ8_9PLEO|nr:unnamed protein product [Periconia digitata]
MVRLRLTPSRLLLAFLICLLFFLSPKLLHRRRRFDNIDASIASVQPAASYGTECSPFSSDGLNDVAIVLKMTTAQVTAQLPSYLSRIGRCLTSEHLLLFSDRTQEYNDLPIHDALKYLRPEYKYQNPDFDLYDQIQRGETVDATPLDKYKQILIMEQTWKHRPQKDWFVFLELDTYVNWDNLHRFLSRFDPSVPYYFGSPVLPRKKPFAAQATSGIILSRAALNKLMSKGRMFAENHHAVGTHLFGLDLTQETRGDLVLAKVLKQSGVSLRGYDPAFTNDSPSTIRFGSSQWCEVVITLHSNDSELARWETTRQTPATPLTFAELFTHIEPSLQPRIDDWTNLSEKVIGPATTVDACRAACARDKKCIQFEYVGESCRISHGVRLGYAHPPTPEDDRKTTAGWMVERIPAFKQLQSRRCKGAHLVRADP